LAGLTGGGFGSSPIWVNIFLILFSSNIEESILVLPPQESQIVISILKTLFNSFAHFIFPFLSRALVISSFFFFSCSLSSFLLVASFGLFLE
jgi:hypothetical protein